MERWADFQKSDDPYFFYPLQLVSDSQVQLYSPYVRVQEAIADDQESPA